MSPLDLHPRDETFVLCPARQRAHDRLTSHLKARQHERADGSVVHHAKQPTRNEPVPTELLERAAPAVKHSAKRRRRRAERYKILQLPQVKTPREYEVRAGRVRDRLELLGTANNVGVLGRADAPSKVALGCITSDRRETRTS